MPTVTVELKLKDKDKRDSGAITVSIPVEAEISSRRNCVFSRPELRDLQCDLPCAGIPVPVAVFVALNLAHRRARTLCHVGPGLDLYDPLGRTPRAPRAASYITTRDTAVASTPSIKLAAGWSVRRPSVDPILQ